MDDADSRGRWIRLLRPVVWFAAASMMTTILHELTHACLAWTLGVRSTLFNYRVNLDLTPEQAVSSQRALIGISGPLVCLAFGMLAWLAFRRARGSAAGLPLLYLAVFGIGTFCGNLMTAASMGDFSAAAIILDLPMPARLVLAGAGGLAVAAIHLLAGRELARMVPGKASNLSRAFGIILLPAALGTAAVILVNQPMPPSAVAARAAEGSFWLLAAIGALVMPGTSGNGPGRLRLRWADGAAILIAVVAVRLMVRGIPFVP